MSDLNLSEVASDLVARAKTAGASASDVVAVNGSHTSIDALNGKLENTERSEGLSVGLRVFTGQSQAIVTANRFSDKDRADLVERAVAMAKSAPRDPFAGLADESLLAANLPDLDICDTTRLSVDDLLAMALEAEAAGLAGDKISQSGGSSASARRNQVVLATSSGFLGEYERTGFSCAVSLIAGSGTQMARDYDYTSCVHASDMDAPEKIGRTAAERTVRRLNPRKASSQKCPVIFDRRLAGSLVGHLSSAVNGSSVARGTSFLKQKMGKTVFAETVNIIDDARKQRGLASKPFDGEGVATARRNIIEKGVLKSWLLDCRSARQLKLTTTGHAGRGTSSGPSPSATNLYLEAGERTPQEMIADIKNGLLVTELIGMGVNGVTGDYSRGASGFWIENGEIAYPVNEITIASNLMDMFANLTPANDLEFHGQTNAPSCLVSEMTIAGQ